MDIGSVEYWIDRPIMELVKAVSVENDPNGPYALAFEGVKLWIQTQCLERYLL